MTVTVYAYSGCGTCKKALAWLRDHGVAHTIVPIREQPPTTAVLRTVLERTGLPLRKLFNTSGMDYRAMNIKDRLDSLSEEEALALLAAHGNLVKRPLVIAPSLALVGFNETEWAAAFKVN